MAKRDPLQTRVLGPYTDTHPVTGEKTYRVVSIAPDGKRKSVTYATKELARAAMVVARGAGALRGPQTVGELVDLFIANKRKTGAWSERTVVDSGRPILEFASPYSTPLSQVDDDFVRAWLATMAEPRPNKPKGLAMATRRSRYLAVAECLAWCHKRRYLPENPCDLLDEDDLPWTTRAGARLVGKGKPQLTRDEALRYTRAALLYDEPEDRIAALLPLLTGLASGEVLHLRVRDLDFSGQLIWVRDGVDRQDDWRTKTKSRGKPVQMPDLLSKAMRFLCAGRFGEEYFFQTNVVRRAGEPWSDHWLQRLVRRTCEKAGVPVTCPHGLRGTYASLMHALGRATMPQVADLLRHGDHGQTAQAHYVQQQQPRESLRLVS